MLKKLTITAIAVPALVMLVNFALYLLNQGNDGLVLVGYGILAALVIGVVWLIQKYKYRLAKFFHFVPLVMLVLSTTGCYTTVGPGNVGIKVKQTGGDRGVQDIPIETGRVFYNPLNENVLEYPTNVRRAIWTKSTTEGSDKNEEIAFQSSDSLHFAADVAVAYHLLQLKVPHFYVQFRSDDLDAFTHGFFRDAVRTSIGEASVSFTAEEINGSKQADLIFLAQDSLVRRMEKYGVAIDQLAFTSPPRPPDQVKNAIEAKIAAIQSAERVENQKRETTAEGEKIKIRAAAEAEANRLITSSISPTLVEWEKIKKWDGKLSQVQGSVTPMLGIK